jgi:hypothetical protein
MAEEKTMYTIDDFMVGQRVQLHPGTDRWMMGDRHGVVMHVNRKRGKYVQVLMDRSNKLVRALPANLLPVD